MMSEIRVIGPEDPELRAWHTVIAAAYAAGREMSWWESYDATRAALTDQEERSELVALVARVGLRGSLVVGGALLDLPLDADTQTVSVELGVAPGHRGRGIGAALAERALALAVSRGRDVVQTELFVPAGVGWGQWPGARFAERCGVRSVSTEDRFLLDLPVDPARLDVIEASLPDDPSTHVVSWVGACPEEHLTEWARMKTQMNEDVPIGDLTHTPRRIDEDRVRESDRRMAGRGWTKVRSIALGPAGEGVGYTELLVSAHDLDLVLQDDTLVDRAHRGRRLGARLKLANLRLLHACSDELIGPRHAVQTFTAQGNTAMQRTNEVFGFRRVDVLHACEGPVRHRGPGTPSAG